MLINTYSVCKTPRSLLKSIRLATLLLVMCCVCEAVLCACFSIWILARNNMKQFHLLLERDEGSREEECAEVKLDEQHAEELTPVV